MELQLNNTPPPEDEGVLQLNDPAAAAPTNPAVASKRAYKATAAIPDLGVSYGDANRMIADGEEGNLRQQAASTVDAKKAAQRAKFIIAAANHGNLKSIPPEQLADPNSVIEDQYADHWLAGIDETAARKETDWTDAIAEDPDHVVLAKTAGTRLASQQQFIEKELDDAREVAKNQSTGGMLVDIGKTAFPGYTDLKLRGYGDTSRFYGLLGTHLEETAKDILRTLNYEDFKTKVSTIMTGLKRDNPALAVMFGEYLAGSDASRTAADNVFSAIDLVSVPGMVKFAGGFLRKGASAAITRAEVNQIVKDVAKGVTKEGEPLPVARASAVGDAEEAAVQKATGNTIAKFEGTADPSKEALEALPRGMKAQIPEIAANEGNLGREIVNRLTEQTDNFANTMTRTIAEISKVETLPRALLAESAVRRIKDSIKDTFPGISNSVLDIGDVRWNHVTNTYSTDMFLGQTSGELFFKKKEAQALIKREGLLDAEIKKQGLGYYIVLNKNLRQNDTIIRDLWHEATLYDKENMTRKGVINDLASWIKTPEDTMSIQERVNRKVAAYGQHSLEQLVKENARYIKDVARGIVRTDPVTGEAIGPIQNKLNAVVSYIKGDTKKVWSEWDRTIKANRDMVDPTAKPDPLTGQIQKGYFFKSPGELDDFYLRSFGRTPSFEETEAYFAYKRGIELDHTLRNLSIYRNKASLGYEQHMFTMVDANGKKIKSPFFDGVQLKHFPGGDDSILVIGDTPGSEKVYRLGINQLNTKQLREFRAAVEDGSMRVTKLWDPEVRPFEGLSDAIGSQRIRYVLSKNMESKALSWDQLPRRAGGHFDYDYDHYIKQAVIWPERLRKSMVHWYEGDTTVMPIALRKMGREVVDTLNDIRTLMVANRMDEAKALFNSKIPVQLEWREFRSWFTPTKINGVTKQARLNLKEPFYMVPKGKNIVDLDKSLEARYPGTFKDGTKSGSDARQYSVQYTGKRDAYDLFTFKDVGTPGNPIYKYEPAALVDPLPSMNRALRRIINSTFMDDYKKFSVENWLREASSFLKADENELRSSPYWHFNNPDWKAGIDIQDKSRLMANRFKIMQFTGTPHKIDTALHSVAQTLADSIYGRFGPQGIGITAGPVNLRLDPVWLASSLKDPFRFIRTMTFHAKLGLYALPQLWIQAQTYALIAGISPRYAAMGTQAALLHGWTGLNKSPEILAALDKIASKKLIPGLPHWKPGEFTEALAEGNKTGFFHVGGEYALLDSSMSPEVIQHMGKEFLNAGAVFFRGGERAVRSGAWFTAFKEFREANPIGRLTNSDRNRILERADLLTSNMSRASASLLHNGVLSFPAQFLTYQIRNAELFWGKRLGETAGERALARARILAVYGALYGVPGAAGVSGLPVGDYLRQYALNNGYVVGEKYWSSLLGEGIPSVMAALATGGGDMQKGNFYDIGPRYGNQGFQVMRDALQSDKTTLSLLGGAAGQTVANTIANMSGFFAATQAFLTGDPKSFPAKPEDIIKAASEISSVKSVRQAYVGAKTGQWINSSGAFVDPTSVTNALFMAAFGLSPQRQKDLYLQGLNHKDELETQKDALKPFIENARNAFRAMRDNDPQQHDDYMRRAFSYLVPSGYPPEKWSNALSLAAKGYESMIVQADRNFYLGKDVPTDKRELYRKTYETLQSIKQKREQ